MRKDEHMINDKKQNKTKHEAHTKQILAASSNKTVSSINFWAKIVFIPDVNRLSFFSQRYKFYSAAVARCV